MKPNKLLSALLCLSLAITPVSPLLALDTRLPELGASAGRIMAPQREAELGRAFMRSVRKTQKVIEDPLIDDYISTLGRELTRHSSASGRHFDFFLIDNPTINAFAGPDGHIGVYTGLLLTTRDEDELAAVLAHEIAHVSQQHLLRTWELADQMALPNAAILLAAMILGAAAGGNAGVAAVAGGQAALLQNQINFTRANEKEADRIGIELLARTGHEPRAMASFFDRMGKANRYYASELPELLMTHPVTVNRISDATSRADQFAHTARPSSSRYHMIRMHLRQLQFVDAQQAIAALQQSLEEGRHASSDGVEYGLMMAHLRSGNVKQAKALYARLNKKHHESLEMVVAGARIATEQKNYAQALQILQTALLDQPGSRALNLILAETALAADQPKVASEALTQYTHFNTRDPQVYYLLALAMGAQNNPLMAHQHNATYQYLKGDLKAAILQLELASELPGIDFYDSARVDARLENYKKELLIEKSRE